MSRRWVIENMRKIEWLIDERITRLFSFSFLFRIVSNIFFFLLSHTHTLSLSHLYTVSPLHKHTQQCEYPSAYCNDYLLNFTYFYKSYVGLAVFPIQTSIQKVSITVRLINFNSYKDKSMMYVDGNSRNCSICCQIYICRWQKSCDVIFS